MKQIVRWLTSFKKECSVCTGTGRIACSCNENHEIVCPNCDGKGVVPRQVTTTQKMEMPCDNPQCQQGKVLCGICNGTGKKPQGGSCSVCHGSGKVICTVCGGTDRVERVKQESWLEHETCHVCNGRGVVDCYLCHGSKERVCPTCNGKGVVWDKGKLAVFAMIAVLLLAMPMLVIAIAAIGLGGSLFMLWKSYKQKNDSCTSSEDKRQQSSNQ